RPDARDRHQAMCRLVGAGMRRELSVERFDTAVEARPLLTDLGDESLDTRANLRLGIRHENADRRLELAAALRENETALQQDRAELVHEHGAHADQPRPDPVQAMHVELLLRLEG